MSSLLAAIAAPAAFSLARTAGNAVASGVQSFGDALADAATATTPTAACSACDDETPTLRERLEQRLSKLLGPFFGSGDVIGASLDPVSGDLVVSGDSPAATTLRQALADDPQLQSDLNDFIASGRERSDSTLLGDVFSRSPEVQVDLSGDSLALDLL